MSEDLQDLVVAVNLAVRERWDGSPLLATVEAVEADRVIVRLEAILGESAGAASDVYAYGYQVDSDGRVSLDLVGVPVRESWTPVAQAAAVAKAEARLDSRIVKADGVRHLIYGVVAEPEAVDAHGDWIAAEDIEAAAHGWMRTSRAVFVQHQSPLRAVEVVESYIAPVDLALGEGEDGLVRAGSWVLVTHVDVTQAEGATIWEAVEQGRLTGYSLRGSAWRADAMEPPAG